MLAESVERLILTNMNVLVLQVCSNKGGSFCPAAAVDQSMQLGILHVAQDPCGVIKFAVVEVRQCGDRLGIRR